MQKYKGVVKFVSNTGELALVEQIAIRSDLDVDDIIIGYCTSTGTSADLIVSGSVGSLIREGSVEITFGAVSTVVGTDLSLATSTGLKAVTSTGVCTVLNGVVYTSTGTYDATTGNFGWLHGSRMSLSHTVGFPFINYATGDFKIVADTTIGVKGTAVKMSYTRDAPDAYDEQVTMLRGDFSAVEVGDTIYYYYTASSDYADDITIERPGQ